MIFGHWTAGLGSGHIRRANALVAALRVRNSSLTYHVFAGQTKFGHILHPAAQLKSQPLNYYDIFIVDQALDKLPPALLGLSNRYIQLCKIGTTLQSTKAPPGLEQISIEDCRTNSRAGLKSHGVLLDLDPSTLLERKEALNLISLKIGARLPSPFGLIFVNTWDANAAHTFVSAGIQYLNNKTASIIVSSSHRGPFLDRVKLRHPEPKVHALALSPLYPYLSSFDIIFSPVGYNSYSETQLLRTSDQQIQYCPMFPTDQAQRYREFPPVKRLLNAALSKYLLSGLTSGFKPTEAELSA